MQGYWQVDMDSVSLNGNQTVSQISSIIDTGTTQILGDTANVAAIYAQIPGAALAPEEGDGIYTSMAPLTKPHLWFDADEVLHCSTLRL